MHDHRSSAVPKRPIPPAEEQPPAQRSPGPRFLSVEVAAGTLGISEATMYRAVRAGGFPAVRIRNRYAIPASALDALEDAALSSGGVVDAADWVESEGAA